MRKTQVGAVVSSAALLTTMASQVAWGAPAQSSVCSTFQNDLVAFDAAVNADSAVRAADAAYAKAKVNATRAYKIDKAAYVALAKARTTKNKTKIAKALAAYRKAHAARVAAGRVVAATKARADYVRAITWQQLKSVVDAACIQPPSNLTAVATNGDVSLTWTGPTDVAGYRVYRNGVLVATVTAQTFSFDDSNVKNGTTYNYMVRSFVFDAESQDSNVVTATPMLPAPQDLNATPGDARVALSWSSVVGATSYQVWRNGAQITTRTSTSYTDTAVTNGTTYTYTVRAVAGNSVSGDSDSADATPQAAVVNPPSAPTNLVATGGAGKIDLTWTASSGATGYKILRGGTQIGTSTTASYSDTTVIPGTTYSYTVVATNGSLSSGATAAASASATAAPPANFTATAGDTTVSLTWSAANGATGYQVFRDGTQIAAPTTTSYNDSGLTDGQAYVYTVRTVVGSLVSADSVARTVTPNKPSVLAAPTGVTAGTATSLNTGAFRLSWTAVAGATSYSVYSDGTLLGTSTTTTYTPATQPAFAASHAYTVMATNGNAPQNSPLSAPVTAAVYQGPAVNDANGRTIYGQIQTYIVVTIAASKTITGCWATYPTTSDSGSINPKAIPTLCSRTLTAQPTSANATTVITNASGASFTSPAFKSSLQQALVLAGM